LSALSFGILGPVCAWQDGQEFDLGPGKQRAVLAVLLLNANQPVSASEIVEAVWGEAPPANGANMVQKRVSGLRNAFEPERPPRVPGQLLDLTDAGYLLRVQPGQLDTDRLRSHLDQARAARNAGQPEVALRELHAGLRLWRGSPLAGLAGPFFEAERHRLTEIYASALEDAMAVELELGRHQHVVPELFRLVTEHPLRERLRYLLMQALARSGRQAEALAVYRDARRYLVDELGIEPGNELRELHQQILTAEVTPATAANGRQRSAVDSVVSGSMDYLRMPIMAAPSRWRRIATSWVVLVPLLSMGFLSWVPAAYTAVRLHKRRYWFAAAAYVATFFAIMMTGGVPRGALRDNLQGLLVFGSWVAGTVQGFWFRARLLDQFADPATIEVIARQVRRQLAYQLLNFHPEAAQNLNIGRPDLPRQFDDGGLVDINSVPMHVFAALPGVGAERAQHIVSVRQRIGRFASVDDLAARRLLPLNVLDPLRDILVALSHPQTTG